LEGRTALSDHLHPGVVVRIESPERDVEVEKGLLRLGISEAESEGTPVMTEAQIEAVSFDRGLIRHPRQAFLGFRRLLRRFATELAARNVSGMNAPGDIEVMFEKSSCHQKLREAGVPVPQSLGLVRNYEELTHRMSRANLSRVFVKLNNGSAASGMVALHRTMHRPIAVTTVAMARDSNILRLYNSRRLRCYSVESEVATLVNALCRERVHVEEWLPKATLDALGNFDLRVVVIGGRTKHVVVRHSQGPFTNLHLLNRRGDFNRVRDRLGETGWSTIRSTCELAMSLFPNSLYAGLDVLVMPGFRRHAVLELNAFGDLLPDVRFDGRDTYATELLLASTTS
jgi:hypothetical protein